MDGSPCEPSTFAKCRGRYSPSRVNALARLALDWLSLLEIEIALVRGSNFFIASYCDVRFTNYRYVSQFVLCLFLEVVILLCG